jgi:hypothetical protein
MIPIPVFIEGKIKTGYVSVVSEDSIVGIRANYTSSKNVSSLQTIKVST